MSNTQADSEFIYVASYWNKQANKRIYARSYGLKAFRIRVKPKRTRKK